MCVVLCDTEIIGGCKICHDVDQVNVLCLPQLVTLDIAHIACVRG